MKNTSLVAPPVRYRDFYVRLITAIVAAHIVTVFGETKSTFELLMMPGYYLGFAVSLLIALLLINYIYWITVRLDRKYAWEGKPLVRTLLQLLLGLVVPALLDFLQAWLYMRSYGVDILKTTYVSHDFQYILLMLAILNAYYIAFYFYLRWEQTFQLAKDLTAGEPESKSGPLRQQYFMVSSGSRQIALPLEDICFFYRKEDANYLLTFSGERYYISQNLDDISLQLSHLFYRANRQLVFNQRTLIGHKSIDNGKIELDLQPPFHEPVVVSSKRAKAFREWVRSRL